MKSLKCMVIITLIFTYYDASMFQINPNHQAALFVNSHLKIFCAFDQIKKCFVIWFSKKLLIQVNFNNCKNMTTISHCSQCKHITGHFQVVSYKSTDWGNLERKPTCYERISIASPLPDVRKYCLFEHFLSFVFSSTIKLPQA